MATPPPGADQPRVTALDGLRGIAIGMILLHHYVQLHLPPTPGWPRALDRLLALSWSGVDLFFVLSGFLIGGILIDHRDSPRLPRAFYVRRGFRILPVYLLALVAALGWLYPHPPLSPPWAYFTFTSNVAYVVTGHWDYAALAVTWSLAVEEQFYLVAPWVVRWTPPARLVPLLLWTVAAAWALRLAAHALDPNGSACHVLMPCRMDAFALGLLAACVLRSPPARAWFTRSPRRNWLLLALGALPLAALTAGYHSLADRALPLYGYTALAAFYSLALCVILLHPAGWLQRLLGWAPLVSLGRLSYFIYLGHMLVLVSLGRFLAGSNDFNLDSSRSIAAVIACAAAVWGLAWCSWRFFEGPLVQLGRRHAY